MLSPVEKNISRDRHITRAYEWLLVNSPILVGIGLAPLMLAPLSEVYGRKPVLVVGSIIFVVWNTGCGAARTLGQMLACRLLSGFGPSVADALAGGVMGDLWRAEERGNAFAIFMAAPLMGPALGPICGAFISEGVDWRWVFWSSLSLPGSVSRSTPSMLTRSMPRQLFRPTSWHEAFLPLCFRSLLRTCSTLWVSASERRHWREDLRLSERLLS